MQPGFNPAFFGGGGNQVGGGGGDCGSWRQVAETEIVPGKLIKERTQRDLRFAHGFSQVTYVGGLGVLQRVPTGRLQRRTGSVHDLCLKEGHTVGQSLENGLAAGDLVDGDVVVLENLRVVCETVLGDVETPLHRLRGYKDRGEDLLVGEAGGYVTGNNDTAV